MDTSFPFPFLIPDSILLQPLKLLTLLLDVPFPSFLFELDIQLHFLDLAPLNT